ncbi:hypothetical protein K3495_g11745 [Podosphaera aphanis]|nr:hypothetical protein K3495_g11745 [Podosphaera aphanis]
MSPAKYKIRIQNLVQVQPAPPRSSKHPIDQTWKKKQDASKNLFRKFARVAKKLLSKITSTKNQSLTGTAEFPLSPPTNMMAPYFELPKITPINFSLTEGTDIPSPPASPIEDKAISIREPPLPQVVASSDSNQPIIHNSKDSASSHRSSNDESCTDQASNEQKIDADEETPFEPVPLSPIFTKQPSSIRKFLSRRSLNANYTNDSCLSLNLPRPESAMSYVSGNTTLSNGKRRALGWFSRFGGGQVRKRTSIVMEEKSVIELPPSPPPPMLPKLSQLRAKISEEGEGLGAEDMFKDIR